jgi:hypothetical protein
MSGSQGGVSMAQPRTASTTVATKPGCAPLKHAYDQAVEKKPKSWPQVEQLFLEAMAKFDDNVAAGVADMGDLQNGKGDFLNDLLALLLENCADVQLYSRGSVPGLIIPRHNLDVTFPRNGPIEFILEAKALGTPKHPWSPKAKPLGRGGSADLDKRIKEVGFKSIDLKAEYARILASQGTSPTSITGDLTGWLRSVKPRSYLFLAARVLSKTDRDRVIRLSEQAALVVDAVGVYCFEPVRGVTPTRYQRVAVPSPLEIGRVLFRACQELTGIKTARPQDA